MGFREREKKRLVCLKKQLFSNKACIAGHYKGKVYDFCLADDCSAENLYSGIRDEALAYFAERRIGWHDGLEQGRSLPSNHLCCSQCACVNFMFPFARDPDSLGKVLVDMGYPVARILPFDGDTPLADGTLPHVAFEWIGARNYLGELSMGREAADTQRTRGANFTSADFAIRFERSDGKVEIILGEWKYTERYPRGQSLQVSRSGTDRLDKVYRKHLEKARLRLPAGVRFEDLFYDPFDQMMRLQLLAAAMEREKEHADIVSVLHVAPKSNTDLVERTTSPGLAEALPGRDVHQIWQFLAPADRFIGLYVEDLLQMAQRHAPDREWADYLAVRYNMEPVQKNGRRS